MGSSVVEFENWQRREIFEQFSKISSPFYVVSFNIEIQNLYRYCKKNHIGLYHAMVWCITKAINSVSAFRQRIIDGKVIEFEETYPSFTFLKRGEEAFKVCTLRARDSMADFDAEAKRMEEAQTTMFGNSDLPGSQLFYLSCLPWIETTCVSSERDLDVDDCIPRISWGKYKVLPGGEIIQNITADVNHRLVDGYHIGVFGQNLQSIINSFNGQ